MQVGVDLANCPLTLGVNEVAVVWKVMYYVALFRFMMDVWPFRYMPTSELH